MKNLLDATGTIGAKVGAEIAPATTPEVLGHEVVPNRRMGQQTDWEIEHLLALGSCFNIDDVFC